MLSKEDIINANLLKYTNVYNYPEKRIFDVST